MSTLDGGQETPNIGQIAEQILALLPESVAQVIRMGAVPHRLSPELLALLAGDPDLTNAVRRTLNQLSLTHSDEADIIVYHNLLRQACRQQLRINNPRLMSETNQTLYHYFITAVAEGDSANTSLNEQEAFYHLLQFDVDRALDQFGRQFETFITTGQVNRAEQYVALAAELRDEFDPDTRGWITYWQARIDLCYGHLLSAQIAFAELAHADHARLRAVSWWGTGLVHVAQHHWSRAISTFQQALLQLQAIGDQFYTTHLYLALGFAYQDLAEKSGGLGKPHGERLSEQARTLWDVIEQLPFNLYTALAKRITWLPTWSLDTNYQNWIIYYLLRQGRKWYRRAEKLAIDGEDYDSNFEAQRRIAHLDLALGRAAKAVKDYQRLLTLPQVNTSRYRTAQTELGLGRAYLELNQFDTATSLISAAATALAEFSDHQAVGSSMRYLGYIYARGGQLSAAIDAYQRSINAFDAISEVLEYTTSVIALEKLTPEVSTEGDLQTRINRISQSVQKRAYVARFPDRLLRLFRRISLLVALPISFFSIFILTAFFVSVLFNLEGGVRLFLIGEPIDLAIFRSTILLTIVMIGFLAIVWLYRLIYTTIGAVVVSLLGRNLIVVEQEEPICYTVDSSRLQIQSGHLASQEQTLTIPWNEIVQVSSLVYYRWGSPIALYSTTQVILKDLSTVDIPALTNHYTDLIHMIKRNVSESAKLSTFSFSVFRSWFSIVTIVTALLISIGRVFTRELFDLPGFCLTRAVAEGRQPVPLWITSVMLFFLVSLLLLFQTGLLWRLLLHQNTIRRQSGYRSKALPASVIFVLAVLSTLLTILWAIFLYRLPYL